jgi:hypothetical protein
MSADPISAIFDGCLPCSSWLVLLKGELYKAPVKIPQKILDLGTGTGIWAIDIAEYFSVHLPLDPWLINLEEVPRSSGNWN